MTTDAITAGSPLAMDYKQKLKNLKTEDATETIEVEANPSDANKRYDELAKNLVTLFDVLGETMRLLRWAIKREIKLTSNSHSLSFFSFSFSSSLPFLFLLSVGDIKRPLSSFLSSSTRPYVHSRHLHHHWRKGYERRKYMWRLRRWAGRYLQWLNVRHDNVHIIPLAMLKNYCSNRTPTEVETSDGKEYVECTPTTETCSSSTDSLVNGDIAVSYCCLRQFPN